MGIKCPAGFRNKFLGRRLCNIMEYCCPSQPEVAGPGCNIVKDCNGMVKIIFMTNAIDHFDPLQFHKLGKDDLQYARIEEEPETDGRYRRFDNMVQLIGDPLCRKDRYYFCIPFYGFETNRVDGEIKLGGKPYGTDRSE